MRDLHHEPVSATCFRFLISRAHRFVLTVLVAVVSLSSAACFAAATEVESVEYSVKAAFLVKFGEYVEWPSTAFATPTSPMVIGVLGGDPFNSRLDRITPGRTIGGHPVVLKHINDVAQIGTLHVLFIGTSERENMGSIRSALQDKGVLTVADFAQPGIVVTFVIDHNKVRFNIDLEQANLAGVKLSSKLLDVAKTVYRR